MMPANDFIKLVDLDAPADLGCESDSRPRIFRRVLRFTYIDEVSVFAQLRSDHIEVPPINKRPVGKRGSTFKA